jgi:hypothetical protein
MYPFFFDQMMFFWPLFLVLVIWSIIWKGLALWRAARSNRVNWFIVMLVLNTAGLLEIFYLLVIDRTAASVESADSQTPQK